MFDKLSGRCVYVSRFFRCSVCFCRIVISNRNDRWCKAIVSSYQADSLIAQIKNISENTIVYKYFKTKDEIITTKHIVDGTVFTVEDIAYVVRSSLYNYDKIYATRTTFFGSQQIVVNSQEGIAIMNDAKYLSCVSIQITGFAVLSGGKIKHGYLENGSSFTANDIHYVVRS